MTEIPESRLKTTNTTYVLPAPVYEQLKQLAKVYGHDRMVVIVAIQQLWNQIAGLKLASGINLNDTNAAALALIATRDCLAQIGDLVTMTLQERDGEPRYAEAVQCLKTVLALVKEVLEPEQNAS